MKWLYNMKIGVKLISGFILVAMIAGAIGVLGIYNLKAIEKSDMEMYKENALALSNMGEIGSSYQLIRVNTRDIMINQDPEMQKVYNDSIQEYDASIKQLMVELDHQITSEEARKNFNAFSESLEAYNIVRDRYIELIMSNDIAGAKQYMLEQRDTALAVDTNLDALRASVENSAQQKSESNSAMAAKAINTSIIILSIGVVFALFLGIFLSRIISKPLVKLVAAADKMADGELDITIDNIGKDEVGVLSASFSRMAENLNDVLSSISAASEQVASGSKQVSDSSLALSQGATEQASAIEQLTASIEQIAAQTRLNAQNANEANSLSVTASKNAATGNDQMGHMLRAMEEINESSSSISKIIKVIDEIAFQTNILALNAAVEAARAGQHGKGFAVVAEEVRNLAARSANAAKETTAMIEGSIKKVNDGTKIANDTATALVSIVSDVSKVASLINDIAVASNEQELGINQINQGVMQVSEVVQTNSATSEETAAASEELSEQAETMREQVSRFTLKRNKKNNHRDIDGARPEVLRMLEGISDKKKNQHYQDTARDEAAAAGHSVKINLSDKEFGKY